MCDGQCTDENHFCNGQTCECLEGYAFEEQSEQCRCIEGYDDYKNRIFGYKKKLTIVK